jgi:transitional endoplasmic reticulum ATPase
MANPKSQDERIRAEILAKLDELGGLSVQDETLSFTGDSFILPASYAGPDGITRAKDYLSTWERNMTETFSYSRTFPYRPFDGAAAFDRALRRMFGTSGIGVAQHTMFGTYPPEMKDIEIGHGKRTQVPWGQILMPMLDAQFYTGGTKDRVNGYVFQLTAEAPKRNRRRIEAFFDLVDDELKQRSIYRGKAVTGGDELSLEFVDLSTVDPAKVIYSRETFKQLEANIWTPLRHSETMRRLGSPLKRAVLLEGPWGTGKTLSGVLTGQVATENGWTFVLARPGQDNLDQMLRTARLYAPSVVWYEDIDVLTAGDPKYISRLLDTLDGVSAKGKEVIVGFTSNHAERIAKGVMRPGRIDAVIHFGELEPAEVEPLVRSVLSADLLSPGIDWATVADALCGPGYVAAFAREVVDRALRFSVAENNGTPAPLTTEDLTHAAKGLHDQLALMNDASEGTEHRTIDAELRDMVEGVLNRTVIDPDGREDSVTVRNA